MREKERTKKKVFFPLFLVNERVWIKFKLIKVRRRRKGNNNNNNNESPGLFYVYMVRSSTTPVLRYNISFLFYHLNIPHMNLSF